MKIKVENI